MGVGFGVQSLGFRDYFGLQSCWFQDFVTRDVGILCHRVSGSNICQSHQEPTSIMPCDRQGTKDLGPQESVLWAPRAWYRSNLHYKKTILSCLSCMDQVYPFNKWTLNAETDP